MNLFRASRLALSAVTLLCTLHACASSEPPSDDELADDDVEERPDPEPPSDDDADDEVTPPARDAGSSTGSGGKDAAQPPPKDAGGDSPNEEGAAPGKTKDAGSDDATTTRADAASAAPVSDAAADLPALPDLFGDGGLLAPKIPGPPSPDNPKECPPVAPDNPIGSCLGVPVYATCTYGTYACICDWFHWICI